MEKVLLVHLYVAVIARDASLEWWLPPELSSQHSKSGWDLRTSAGRLLAMFRFVFLERDK